MFYVLLRTFYRNEIERIEESIFANVWWNFPKQTIAFTIKKSYITSLKLASATFYQIFIFSQNDSPHKTMKNVVYLI